MEAQKDAVSIVNYVSVLLEKLDYQYVVGCQMAGGGRYCVLECCTVRYVPDGAALY